jgi:CubicO group peptidase (beta-lactamase class C family)
MLPPLEPNEALLARVVDDALIGSDLGEAGGLAVGVLHRGAAYRYARGFVDSGRRRTPASMTTPFRLASITKTMTAVVTLQLVEEGALALEDTVGALLPAVPPPWRHITVRQLLTHTSGIPHHPPRGPGSFLNIHLDTEQTLRLIARRPLVAPPGERFTYSTYGYGVLGAILERVERRPLRDILAERITDPLGMTGTFIEDSRRRRPDWPVGWRVDRVRGGLVPSRRIDVSTREAGGGARGTVDDLLVFGEALLRDTLISADSFRAMTTPTELPDGTLVDYGLGVAVYPRRGLRVVAHAGGQSETTSLLFLVPALDLIVVAITNVEGQGQALSRIADAVVDVLVHDGAAVRDVSALDPADEAVAFVVRRAASWGLSERAGGSLGLIATPEAVDEAFRRFAALLDENRVVATPDEVTDEARGLHHPRAHRVTPLVGLTVAQAVGDVTEAALGAARGEAAAPRRRHATAQHEGRARVSSARRPERRWCRRRRGAPWPDRRRVRAPRHRRRARPRRRRVDSGSAAGRSARGPPQRRAAPALTSGAALARRTRAFV